MRDNDMNWLLKILGSNLLFCIHMQQAGHSYIHHRNCYVNIPKSSQIFFGFLKKLQSTDSTSKKQYIQESLQNQKLYLA